MNRATVILLPLVFATLLAPSAFAHRHYDPEHGRWLQRDPIGYVDGMNLYEYVESGPVIQVDPDGKSSISPITLNIRFAPEAFGVATVISVDADQKRCKRVRWTQYVIYERHEGEGWDYEWKQDDPGMPFVDAKLGDQNRPWYANQYSQRLPRGWKRWTMEDAPGAHYYTDLLHQVFMSCAVCEDACSNEWCFIGCVTWSHVWYGDGSQRRSTGGRFLGKTPPPKVYVGVLVSARAHEVSHVSLRCRTN